MTKTIKILIASVFTIMLICNIKLFLDKNKYRQLHLQEQMKINYLISLNKLYNDIVELDIKGNIGIELSDFQVKSYSDSIATESTLYEYCMSHPNTLFFRFTDAQCTTCYSNELQQLSSLSDSVDTDITLLVTYKQKRSLDRLLYDYTNKFKCLLVDENSMKFILEDYYIPYYFKINNKNKMYSIFVPAKELPHLTQLYLTEHYK